MTHYVLGSRVLIRGKKLLDIYVDRSSDFFININTLVF